MGCQLTVDLDEHGIRAVSGNNCPIGDRYARQEITNPKRTVTSTVILEGGASSRLSVKTEKDIPKDKIFECMKEINRARAHAPVHIGDVIIKNICNTGVNVVATKTAF